MQLDQLRVELRPRSPWEAAELGVALARTHAWAIWKPWLLLSLPVFLAINALGWAFDQLALASLAMWWLKPVFERVPLYVLSRAVFGDAPGVRATLAAQRRWGTGPMWHYLTWRRLGPARSLYLPIDLLEGAANPAERRRVIGGGMRGVAMLLTLACANFEMALNLAFYALALLFVPVEFLPESMRAAWTLATQEPPLWAQVGMNAVTWLAASAIAPFYVGAGFGLYLNRRTEIEAWDVEIALRRLRQRLGAAAAVLLCACTLGLALPRAARADDGNTRASKAAVEREEAKPPTLPQVFGPRLADGADFGKAVEQAYADPLLNAERVETGWKRRHPPKPGERRDSSFRLPKTLRDVLAMLGEASLWLLLALGVGLLLWTRRQWWPWLQRMKADGKPAAAAVSSAPLAEPDSLPDDVPTAARTLWREGRHRRALALLYRASVESMAARTGVVLVPGATEAECLRAARALRDGEDRDAFARIVRVWQYAAYAQRMPGAEEFEALLESLARRFDWSPRAGAATGGVAA